MEPESQEQQESKNPIKRAEKQKQFKTAGKLQEVYTTAEQLYEAACKYKNTFKMVKNQHPKFKDLQIIDISLNGRGPVEDQVYTKYQFYRNNIRRGNTIIYDKKNKQVYWGRKGLTKFFDISQSSLNAIVKEETTTLNQKKHSTHYIIFSEIENALSCNEELSEEAKAAVEVYRLNKANGQNAQISYFQKTNEWVIASKNVAVLLGDKSDLKLYNGTRYQFSKLIAEAWFDIIEKKDKKQIENIKKELINNTIVGEYCGNQQFQHLVKYQQTTIYFYAMVGKESKDTCLPPKVAFNFFEETGLPIVKNHEKSLSGRYTSYTELGNNMIRIFSEVSTSSIFQEEEGSVIYFVMSQTKQFCEYISDRYLQKSVNIPQKWESQPILPRVCTLGKLKTLEYRILRKLRQKLKYFTRLKKNEGGKKEDEFKKFQQKYGSFQKEVYQLVKTEKLNKPLQYFFCAGLLAFEYVFKNRTSPKALQLLTDHFIDFLSVIFWCIENKKQLTPNLMSDWQLVQDLRKVNWDKYGVEIVGQYQNLLNKIVPKYAKVKKIVNNEDQDNNNNQVEQEDDN